ncbi:MAG: DPM/DPG synthase family glycosyltransferase [Candidatus Diapherotrites archaeon]
MKLSVVIPAFNEEKAIEKTLKETLTETKKIKAILPLREAEVIVVDDGSTDSTAEKAKKFRGKGVKIISHKKNSGYGSALKTGFSHSKGDIIAFYDADATYPINRLHELVQVMQKKNADMVIGSRLGKGTKMPKQRLYGNKLFVLMLKLLGGGQVQDTASGMRVFKRKLIPKLVSLPGGLEFTPAMTTKAIHEGWNILFQAIPYKGRIGSSKLSSVGHGLKFFLSILDITKLYNPFRLFGGLGIIFIAIGLSLFHPLIFNSVPFIEFGLRRIIFIIAFLLIGVNLIFFGFLANFIVKLLYDQLHTAIAYKWAYDRFLLTRYIVIGLILFIAGLSIIFFTRPGFHWIVPITGLLFISIAVQLIVSSMIVRILKELYEKRVK